MFYMSNRLLFNKIIGLSEISVDKSHLFHGILIPLHQNSNILQSMANINRIKVVLVEKGKTGRWLANELGKSNCTISKWCSNSIQPDLLTLDKISKLLDVSIKDLLVDNKE